MVAVMLAEGFETIEALTVVDVLRRANIDVKTISLDNNQDILSAQDVIVKADMNANQIDDSEIEMVVLPGGMPGTLNLEHSEIVKNIINKCNDNGKYIAAICAAPRVLGGMKLIDGKDVTCYPGYEQFLGDAHYIQKNVVISDNFITSPGPGYALDFSFSIVEIIKGKEVANQVKHSMICK